MGKELDTLEISKDIKTVNPYTFVPIDRNCKSTVDITEFYRKERLHTGILKCRLYVKTPLAILDTALADKDNNHYTYPFFSYKEKTEEGEIDIPMIPGSSIRGIIRSVFETATGSCMSTMRDKTGLSKRMEASKAYKPGILKKENGKWVLYKAERYLLAVEGKYKNHYLKDSSYVIVKNMEAEDSEQKNCRIVENKDEAEFRFGDFVDFTVVKNELGQKVTNGNENFLIWDGIIESMQMHQDSETEMRSGYVYVGEPFKRKRGESVFYNSGEKVSVTSEKLEEAYQRMAEALKIYRDTAINRSEGHSGYGDFERAEKQEIIPLWYRLIGKKDVDLSLAAIGRIFYGKNLNTLVGEKSPCKDRGHLCRACALFGMTGNESVGSRVRFTDAKLIEDFDDKKDTAKKTLKILGEPRYSYLPFYAKGSAREIPESYDADGVEIMGRKFYWHNMNVNNDSEIYTSQVKNEMNSTVTLLKPEKEFEFNVYYDGINEEQLKQLIWCICIGENKNDSEAKMYHKIGHGKPLGLGSVKIVVENKLERIFENNRYSWKEVQGEEIAKYIKNNPHKNNLKLENEDMLLKVLNKDEPGESQGELLPIEYPDIRKATGEKYTEEERKNNNKLARHLWYAKNKEPGNEDRRALPGIMEEKQGLCAYQKKKSCIWIAQYGLSLSQEKTLRQLLSVGEEITKQRKWLDETDIEKLAAQYSSIALPSKTKSILIKRVQEKFQKVIISKKGNDGKDCGWKVLK